MPKLNRKFYVIFLMLILFVVSVIVFGGSIFKQTVAAEYTGIGEERFKWSREVYGGVDLTHTISYNNNKDQKVNTLVFNPKTVNLQPTIAYGGNALYGSTMTSLIDYEEAEGKHVVFGINGDAYDTSNGIASGLVINDGVLITSSNSAMGWGMLSDGTIKYGSASLQMQAAIVNGETLTLKHVNKERKLDTNGVYLLTEDFNNVTASKEAGVEVILNIVEAHKDLGLRIGQTLSATVTEVVIVERNTTIAGNQTPIGDNQVILSTHANSQKYNLLSGLAVGTQIDFNVNDISDDRIDWSNINFGMGIFHLLLDNGVVPAGIYEDTAIHPRTAMGIKADGSVILFQNDGRQIGWANGLSFKEMVEYMRDELGAVTIFNFDGGGSSTMQVTMPGNNRAEIINRPSDGTERANTNALLFIATEKPVTGNPVEQLHMYTNIPGNNANKAMLLEKGILKFDLKATDNNYYQSSLMSQTVTYTVENDGVSNIGTVSQEGVFTAGTGKGNGRVVAKVGNISTSFEIQIVDEITAIETNLTILSIAPGGTAALDFRAFYNGVPVMLSNESLTFVLNPESLGSVSTSGVFTAVDGQGTGELEVSYKNYVFSIPIEVGKMPAPILDFEEDIFTQGWKKYYTNIPGNGGFGNISINKDERYVKHGDGSLRIDYDFATKPLTGTVAIEIGETGYTVLEGQPTAIGAWVYGDGNGGWFRIQLTGGKYAGDTRINWIGWKYIETPIPIDAPFPYTVQRAVRLLGTASIANNKKGTIYVDSVRAIYDFKNDDNNSPVVEESTISPAQDSTTDNLQETISLRVKDAIVDGSPYTGIDTSRTQMYINNKLITNIQQNINADGSVDINYIPGALDKLRPGVQNVRVRTEDNFGNKTFTEWSFIVSGYAVTLEEVVPKVNKIYAGETFEYCITTPSYRNFASLEVQIAFDKDNLILIDAPIVDSRLSVTQQEIDNVNGEISIIIIGMDATTYDPGINLIKFRFRTKDYVEGTTGIDVIKASVLEGATWTDLILNGFDVPVDYKYVLSYNGSTFEGDTKLTVYADGSPVANAIFVITLNGQIIASDLETDIDGTVTTNLFGTYPLDSQFKVRAIKNDYYSNETVIKVVPSLGTLVPEKIAVTVGTNASTNVGISFQTAHEVDVAKVVVSTNSDLSSSTEFIASRKKVLTTHGGIVREYTAWGAYVTGLDADTKYYYKVGSDQGWSNVLSFTTAKASGDANIAFFGDIQGGYANFPNVVKELYDLYPDIDLNILSGDVSDNAHIYQEWTNLDTYSKQYFNNNIWMATIGNHDVSDGGQAFTGYYYGPNNGTENQEGSRNYWFEINDAIIFNLDTEASFNSYDINFTNQIALLKEVMENTTKGFKIVVMHRSVYPLNYDEPSIRELSSVFEELEIDLVLSGHDHVYNRTTMWDGQKIEVNRGVTYLVGGSGSGSKYYGADETRPWLNVVYDDDNPVFTVLRFVNNTDLVVEAYAVEGTGTRMVDTFTLKNNVEPVIRGDINDDGEVTVADALLLLQAINGKIVLNTDQRFAANITDDSVTLSDVREVLRLIGGQ